jgi:hypothetical protein
MTVESASYISQLVTTSPPNSDPKSEGAAQFRLLKTVLKTQFPNFGTAAMTATVAELNYMVGVTSGVQTQLNTKGAISGQVWTGTHNFTGSTITVPTATVGDNSTKAASTAFVNTVAFSAAVPVVPSDAGKLLTNDGVSPSWSDTLAGSINFFGNGRRITGDLNNFTRANRLLFADSTANGQPVIGVVPTSSGGGGGALECYADPDPDNSAYANTFCNKFAGKAGMTSGKMGTGVTLPLSFQIDGNEALQIDTSRNVKVVLGSFGYGTGAGGTVTQLTSKATSVTLNKPCGTITTHNAALAAGASVSFNVINSFFGTGDTVLVTESAATGVNGDGYRIEVSQASAGFFKVRVTNISAISLSDAVPINFSIIKCVSA